MAERPISATKSENRSKDNKVTTWVVAVTALGLIVVVIGTIFYYGYTTRPGWVGVSDKTFWDYLDLLIVPAVLVLGVYWLSQVQSEREAENQRAQSEALQAYLDAMDALLRDVSLTDSPDQSTYFNRELAQARTITIIATLDAERNRIVTRFLRNLNLTRPPIGILREADLAAAELAGAFLEGADLSGSDLRRADLGEAALSEANLSKADLEGADNLRGAQGVTQEQLDQARSLEGATMPSGQKYEDWLEDSQRGEQKH